MSPSFFHHLHPPTIPKPQARLRHTLGAGGLAVYLSLTLLATGVLEMFYYVPTPEGAAESIQLLTFLVPYGGLVRNMHYWAAQGLLVVSVVHMVRVLLTGGYAAPPPKARPNQERISRDRLVRVEVVAMIAATAVLITISLIFPAPIAPAMTETAPLTADAAAPWFFLWVQTLLKNGDAFFWGVLVPLGVLGLLAALPYLRPSLAPDEIGSWLPKSGRTVQGVTAVIILALLILTFV